MVESTVGVPLISPVEESILKPDGRDGEISQEVTAPPVEVAVTGVITVPFVSVIEVSL